MYWSDNDVRPGPIAPRPDTTIARLLAEAMPQAITDHGTQVELIKLAQAGDTCAKNRLIVGSVGLVVRIMTPYLGAAREVGLQASDLLAAGLYGPNDGWESGLSHAIVKFDVTRNIRLSSYAHFWIRDALQQTLRAAGVVKMPDARRDKPPPPQRVSLEDAELDGVASEEPEDDSEVSALLWAAVEADLTDRERYVIRRRYSRQEASATEIGAELGISRQAVQKIERQAIEKLRDAGSLVDLCPDD